MKSGSIAYLTAVTLVAAEAAYPSPKTDSELFGFQSDLTTKVSERKRAKKEDRLPSDDFRSFKSVVEISIFIRRSILSSFYGHLLACFGYDVKCGRQRCYKFLQFPKTVLRMPSTSLSCNPEHVCRQLRTRGRH